MPTLQPQGASQQTPQRSEAIKNGGGARLRLWVYQGDESEPYTVFAFTPDRSRDGPRNWLGDYRGRLQADAYSGYDELFRTRPDLVEVGCWAHARRYFFEARETDVRAVEALAWIQRLYAVEREADEHDERKNAAQGVAPASALGLPLGRRTAPPEPRGQAQRLAASLPGRNIFDACESRIVVTENPPPREAAGITRQLTL